MFTQHYFTEKTPQLLLAILFCSAGLFALAQNNDSQKSSIAADEWKTFLVNYTKEINVPAPPDKEQTQKELKELN